MDEENVSEDDRGTPGLDPVNKRTPVQWCTPGTTIGPREEVEEELFRTIVDTSFWNSILRLYGADASERQSRDCSYSCRASKDPLTLDWVEPHPQGTYTLQIFETTRTAKTLAERAREVCLEPQAHD